MNRSEILTQAKPILFNTEMVRAIISGRKTQTRRVAPINTDVKCSYDDHEFVSDDFNNTFDYTGYVCRKCGFGVSPPHSRYPVGTSFIRPQYQPGNILYVRETFFEYRGKYEYKADGKHLPLNNMIGGKEFFKWKPSIHMPKEAARIFLRVTGVRAERLQDIDDDGVVAEGLNIGDPFDELWDSTIKKKYLPTYGWEANPWVWVYEFERIMA